MKDSVGPNLDILRDRVDIYVIASKIAADETRELAEAAVNAWSVYVNKFQEYYQAVYDELKNPHIRSQITYDAVTAAIRKVEGIGG